MRQPLEGELVNSKQEEALTKIIPPTTREQDDLLKMKKMNETMMSLYGRM
jgi:hypothetical protein